MSHRRWFDQHAERRHNPLADAGDLAACAGKLFGQFFKPAIDEQDKSLIAHGLSSREQGGPCKAADAASAERCCLQASCIQ